MNPYHRDVLYNLSRLYLLDSAYNKGLPLARTLVTVDPSNPDNYQLIAIAYASMKKGYDAKLKEAEAKAKPYGQRANTSKVAAVMKANIDSAAKINPVIKAYTDSGAVTIDSAHQVPGDDEQASGEGRVHRVHAERGEDVDRRQRNEPDRRELAPFAQDRVPRQGRERGLVAGRHLPVGRAAKAGELHRDGNWCRDRRLPVPESLKLDSVGREQPSWPFSLISAL